MLYDSHPTPLGKLKVTPPELEDKAIEVISSSGYPSIMRIRAEDVPYELNVPGDEEVFVVAWDQS